jgi:hypothetical protein
MSKQIKESDKIAVKNALQEIYAMSHEKYAFCKIALIFKSHHAPYPHLAVKVLQMLNIIKLESFGKGRECKWISTFIPDMAMAEKYIVNCKSDSPFASGKMLTKALNQNESDFDEKWNDLRPIPEPEKPEPEELFKPELAPKAPIIEQTTEGKSLSDFLDQDLVDELKNRGYTGELTYVKKYKL